MPATKVFRGTGSAEAADALETPREEQLGAMARSSEKSTGLAGADAPQGSKRPTLPQLFGVFLYIGATSFGGGVIAYLREHLVERQKWLDHDHFLASLEIGETVPGLISTNVAVIVGSRLRGVLGSVVAVCLRGTGIIRVIDPQERAQDRDPALRQGLGGRRADAVIGARHDRGVPNCHQNSL